MVCVCACARLLNGVLLAMSDDRNCGHFECKLSYIEIINMTLLGLYCVFHWTSISQNLNLSRY